MSEEPKNKGGRPLKYKTPEELWLACDKYFKDCEKNKKPLTMSGLALGIGFEDRRSLVDYKVRDKFSLTIKKAKMICQKYAEDYLFTKGGQIAGAIFNLKNNYGWKDKQEIETTGDLSITIVKEK